MDECIRTSDVRSKEGTHSKAIRHSGSLTNLPQQMSCFSRSPRPTDGSELTYETRGSAIRSKRVCRQWEGKNRKEIDRERNKPPHFSSEINGLVEGFFSVSKWPWQRIEDNKLEIFVQERGNSKLNWAQHRGQGMGARDDDFVSNLKMSTLGEIISGGDANHTASHDDHLLFLTIFALFQWGRSPHCPLTGEENKKR